jgi:membrane dipeptidase
MPTPRIRKHRIIPRIATFAAAALAMISHASEVDTDPFLQRAIELHRQVPLIDGHNDLPFQMRKRGDLCFGQTDLRNPQPDFHTDIPRLRAGGVGAQFWVAYPQYRVPPLEALVHTLEAIDSINAMVAAHPETFEIARTADDIERIFQSGKIASIICVEGGQAINDSLAVLRMFHQLGARYMTLTHNRTHSWADSATDDPRHGGLTDFGKSVVREMNRLGMMVDLSHTSPDVMRDALDVSTSPVLFTHSNARAVTDHPRNVPDEILDRIPENGGLVMATFVPPFTNQQAAGWWSARRARLAALQADGVTRASAIREAMEPWDAANPPPVATLAEVANHIDHLVKRIGIDHVGIGSDFDGITNTVEGLEDVSKFPNLTAELLRRGYSEGDLAKILGANLLRVMRENERRASHSR